MDLADHGNGLPAWARQVLARCVATALSQSLRRAVDVHCDTAITSPVDALAACEPTCRFTLPQAQTPKAVLQLSAELADILLDLLLGGDGRAIKPRGPLTALDRQLLRPAVEQLTAALPLPASPEHCPQSPAPSAVLASLNVTVEQAQGSLQLLLLADPTACVEALLTLADEVEISVGIEEQLDAASFQGLAAGDLLVSDVSPDGEVIVRVGGLPRFAARLGQFNGKRAITITRRLT